jgi:hypothetical protein
VAALQQRQREPAPARLLAEGDQDRDHGDGDDADRRQAALVAEVASARQPNAARAGPRSAGKWVGHPTPFSTTSPPATSGNIHAHETAYAKATKDASGQSVFAPVFGASVPTRLLALVSPRNYSTPREQHRRGPPSVPVPDVVTRQPSQVRSICDSDLGGVQYAAWSVGVTAVISAWKNGA